MNSTGILRKIDELGRVVIPKEIRKKLKVFKHDNMEIFTDSSSIVLKKYEPYCIFCGSDTKTILLNNKLVCYNCIKKINCLKH